MGNRRQRFVFEWSMSAFTDQLLAVLAANFDQEADPETLRQLQATARSLSDDDPIEAAHSWMNALQKISHARLYPEGRSTLRTPVEDVIAEALQGSGSLAEELISDRRAEALAERIELINRRGQPRQLTSEESRRLAEPPRNDF